MFEADAAEHSNRLPNPENPNSKNSALPLSTGSCFQKETEQLKVHGNLCNNSLCQPNMIHVTYVFLLWFSAMHLVPLSWGYALLTKEHPGLLSQKHSRTKRKNTQLHFHIETHILDSFLNFLQKWLYQSITTETTDTGNIKHLLYIVYKVKHDFSFLQINVHILSYICPTSLQ